MHSMSLSFPPNMHILLETYSPQNVNFESHGYKKIAIYGMSYAGETLLNELKDSGITVVYGIDKNAASIYADIKILPKIDSLEEVDAIVVTAITFFDEIEKMLAEETDCPVVSLEDVLFEV